MSARDRTVPPRRAPLAATLAGALLVLAATLAGCGSPGSRGDAGESAARARARLAEEGYTRIVASNDGVWLVGVRPADPPPLNELHERAVAVEPADGDRARLAAVAIDVDCTMPQHLHGMNVVPEVERTAPGRFVVRGLELFMEGEWLFTVDVTEGWRTERAEWWVEPR